MNDWFWVQNMLSRLLRSSVNVGLLVLVNVFWSSQWTAYKIVGMDIGPITVTFLTFLIAATTIFPIFMAERYRGEMIVPSVTPGERSFRLRRNWGAFAVVGIFGLTFASIFGAWGMARTTASNGALLTLTVPIVTALLASMILHERMTRARWASLVIALIGVLILSLKAPESAMQEGLAINWHEMGLLNKDFAAGNLLILLSCTSSCLYNVGSKGLLSRFSCLEVLMYSYFLACVASAVMFIWLEPRSLNTLMSCNARTWLGLIWLGTVVFGLSMVIWLFLLSRLDVSQASVSIYLMPFFGVLIAALLLREPVTIPILIGGAITLIGTILIASADRSEANDIG